MFMCPLDKLAENVLAWSGQTQKFLTSDQSPKNKKYKPKHILVEMALSLSSKTEKSIQIYKKETLFSLNFFLKKQMCAVVSCL